jgi:2-polyprenyl-3-methyl-5-hydroxy-6-metoxy-1,4-benzoquinol methylase
MSRTGRHIYQQIKEDFYQEQTRSVNPLRRWFHLNRYRIGLSLVKAKHRDGKPVVDLGCGSADWNTEGLPVIGVDVNEDLLRAGKRTGRLSDYRVRESAADSGIPPGSCGVVTAFEFLEHVPDYERIILEGRRILEDGGCFIASVPHDTLLSLWRPLFFLQVLWQGYVLGNAYYRKRCGHVNHFSPAAIEQAFLRNGFEVEGVFSMRRFTIFLTARKRGPAGLFCRGSYKDLTVILPTLNEEANITNMLDQLDSRYPGCSVIVADSGSRDRTRELVEKLPYRNVMFLDGSREAVRGLTASVFNAVQAVRTAYFVVMDADGQHPSSRIGDIINILRKGENLVVASRVEVSGRWPLVPKMISYLGTFLGKISLLARGKQYLSYDVLGGFWGCSAAFWQEVLGYGPAEKRFRMAGKKVLFDLLKCLPYRVKIEEVYYRFEANKGKVSKPDFKAYGEFLKACFLP